MFTPGIGVPGVLGVLSLIAVIVIQIFFRLARRSVLHFCRRAAHHRGALLFFVRSLQKGRLSRSFIVLNDQIDGNSTSLSDTKEQQNIGRRGITITPLRPAGIAEFGR